jgi:hypothetical protein
MDAKTRSAQASGGLAVAVGDGLGDGVGVAGGEAHAEKLANTKSRIAASRPRGSRSDEFAMPWAST